MEWLKIFWMATKAGAQLDNSAIWKSRQDLGNVFLTFATVISIVLAHWKIFLGPDDVQNIAGFATTVGLLWNKYFISATSKSVGIGVISARTDKVGSKTESSTDTGTPVMQAESPNSGKRSGDVTSNGDLPEQTASKPELDPSSIFGITG
jgi:hypothetical protein